MYHTLYHIVYIKIYHIIYIIPYHVTSRYVAKVTPSLPLFTHISSYLSAIYLITADPDGRNILQCVIRDPCIKSMYILCSV